MGLREESRKADSTVLTHASPSSFAGRANAQSIANSMWGLAEVGARTPKLVAAVNLKAKAFYIEANFQEVSMTVRSMGVMGVKAPLLAAEIDEHAEAFVAGCFEKGIMQNISNTVDGLSKMGAKAPKLVAAIEARADDFFAKAETQHISKTLWTLDGMGLETPNLVEAINEMAESFSDRCIKEGNTQAVSNTLLAVAGLGSGPAVPNLFRSLLIADAVNMLIKDGNEQAICNTLYAVAIAGGLKEHARAVEALWKEAIRRSEELLVAENLRQLHQVELCAGVEGGDELRLAAVSGSLRTRMDAAAQDVNIGASSSHNEISGLLKNELGFDHENEVSPFPDSRNPGFMAIDMARKEDKVAIEFDGPSHFVTKLDGSFRHNGRTLAKTRLLKALGWTVIRIPWFEWAEAEQNGRKVEFLRATI